MSASGQGRTESHRMRRAYSIIQESSRRGNGAAEKLVIHIKNTDYISLFNAYAQYSHYNNINSIILNNYI